MNELVIYTFDYVEIDQIRTGRIWDSGINDFRYCSFEILSKSNEIEYRKVVDQFGWSGKLNGNGLIGAKFYKIRVLD